MLQFFRKNTIAYQLTLEEAATHLPELVREAQHGQEIIFTQGVEPVAKLVPVGDDTPSDWLTNQPKTSPPEHADRVPKLLRQWQHEFGMPPRPNGKIHTSMEELFCAVGAGRFTSYAGRSRGRTAYLGG